MQYRTHEDGPLTEISIEPGAVVVTMTFDRPGDYTQLHSHAFDHEMQCVKVWPLASGTVLRCVHAHDDIHPDMKPEDGVPIEWLHRLTDEVPFDARG
jgi:hypothetical protein